MGFRRVVLALAMTGFGISAANAAPNHGWYASVEAGANWSTAEGTVTGGLPLGGLLALDHLVPSHPSVDLDTGWTGLAAVGLDIGKYFRVEAELGFRSNDASAHEQVDQTTLMLNALVRLPLLENLSLVAGGGVGADEVSWDDFSVGPPPKSDNQAVFAYQAVVGLNLDLTDRVGLFAKYRYLDAPGVDITGLDVDWNSQTTITIHGDDLRSQSVTIGVQFAL